MVSLKLFGSDISAPIAEMMVQSPILNVFFEAVFTVIHRRPASRNNWVLGVIVGRANFAAACAKMMAHFSLGAHLSLSSYRVRLSRRLFGLCLRIAKLRVFGHVGFLRRGHAEQRVQSSIQLCLQS